MLRLIFFLMDLRARYQCMTRIQRDVKKGKSEKEMAKGLLDGARGGYDGSDDDITIIVVKISFN